jgi:hypothetical protein
LGIKHIILPLYGDRKSLLDLMHHDFKKLFLEGGPTFVHCTHGKDRTGLVVALIKCKYFGEDPDRAIAEAKSLGFGVGVDPRITQLYEKLIRSCKLSKDNNDADIVSIERSYIGDNRGSVQDSASQGTFSPYLDQTKTTIQYLSDLEQSPTRDNVDDAITQHTIEKDIVPVVGLENNNTGGRGFGPVENAGRFFYD